MKRRAERNAVALLALTLLAAQAVAQTPTQTTGQTAVPAAAAAAAAEPAKPSGSGHDLGQTKEQLTRLPSAADMRPTGPVTINANRAELVQNNSAVYIGNVTLDSDTLKMDGDRLELKRAADGSYTAKINGSPAHMSHAGDGPDNPPVSARAKLMTYDSRTGIIDLVGDGLLTRGDDKTTADTIHYHLQEHRYEASGGESGNGRVTIVIPQANAPAPERKTPAAAPAPDASGATAAPAATAPVPATAAPAVTPAAPAPAGDSGTAPAAPKPAQQNAPTP